MESGEFRKSNMDKCTLILLNFLQKSVNKLIELLLALSIFNILPKEFATQEKKNCYTRQEKKSLTS